MKRTFLFLMLSISSLFATSQNLPLLWESRFAGAGDNSDKFNKIIAVPGGNYVAVGFTTRNGNYKDFLTVKMNASLDTLWTRTKNGGSGGEDEAISAAVDASGNIYVAGYSDGGNTKDDIYIVKYDANGTSLWDTAYNDVDSAFMDDRPVDCGIDPSGNFVIAGWTEQGTWALNQDDYLILKYDSNGGMIWRTRYNRSGFQDEASAMAIDATGNIFVTGRSSNGTDDDYVTIKLEGTTGAHLWTPVKIYSGGNGDDRATAIALDNAGFPVVAGRSENSSGDDDYRILKYSSLGILQWTRLWPGAAGGHDRPTAVAIDQTTNDVYVTGQSDQSFVDPPDYDIATLKCNASGGLTWGPRLWGGGALNDDIPTDIAVDAFGNIILCGRTDADPDTSRSNYDWVTLKYDAGGITQYSKIQNGARDDDDEAVSLVIDAAGNAIVAGYINNPNSQKDASRIQYDASGNPIFTKEYNGQGDFDESSHAMVQDAAGNTYIAGYSFTETDNRNIFAGKIDASGNLVDTFFMNGTNDDDDELVSIANDGNGNIYACGRIRTDGEKSNYILLKLNFQAHPLPDTVWSRTYNFISQSDKAISMAADPTGIYVTGASDSDPNDTLDNDDIVTMKYDAGGNILWSQRYDSSLRDEPVKLILGMNNRVYVTGRNLNAHDDDIVLLGYDRTTGNPLNWSIFPAVWNSNFADDDRPLDLIEDGNGSIYVAGYSQSSSFIEDYTLLKYDPAGALQWTLGYDGSASNEDNGNALAINASGNIILAGRTDVNSDPLITNYDYGTFIYDAAGNYVCSAQLPFTYNGSGDGDDVPVAVNVNGNEILVTGQSSEGISTARNKNIMVRIYSEGACAELPAFAEYDGPAGGGDAPNATLIVSSAMFVTGSSDGTDLQKDIITLKYDVTTGLNEVNTLVATSFVYPNPFNSTATMVFSGELAGAALSLKIYNVLGEEVRHIEDVDSSVQLDSDDFADGIYSYKVIHENRIVGGGRFITEQ